VAVRKETCYLKVDYVIDNFVKVAYDEGSKRGQDAQMAS
jgi:hypothetical protein